MISDDTKISSAMNDIFYSDNQNTFSVYVTGGIAYIITLNCILITANKVDQ